MANTVIQLKHSTSSGNTPVSLANGELALNNFDGKLFYRDPGGTIQTIQRFTGPAGLNQEVQFNDSGVLGASANLSFNKTTGLLSAQTVKTNSYIQFSDGTRQYTANAGAGGSVGSGAVIDRKSYTAITGQTTFNVNYAAPYVLVLINGVAVDPSEYTATSNTDIVLSTQAQANDIVDLIGFTGNTNITAIDSVARGHANGAFDKANAANVLAQAAYNAANSVSGTFVQSAFDKANTDATNVSVAAATYGSASIVPVFRVEANGRISTIANSTISIDTSQIASGTLASARISGQYTGITGVGTLANGTWQANSISTTYTDAKITSVGTNTGAISNTQLLDFIKAVDGTGTGLDADLLDGLQGTSYANSTFTQSAYDKANTVGTNAQSAYDKANSSYDAANAKFSSTGGYITGFANVASNISVGSYVDFNTNISTPTNVEGRVFYDNDQKALAYYNDSNMRLQLGQEHVLRVWNKTGSTIAEGKAVYLTEGSSANGFPSVALANAISQVTSEVIGVTTTTIANNAYGYVTVSGKVNNLDTSLFTEGLEVYLSDTIPGGLTQTVPSPPSVPINVGYVTKSDLTAGSFYVSIHLMEGVNKTTGSVLFARNGAIDEDPSHLFWDYANNRLGINTNTPQKNLHVAGDGLFTGNLTISGNLVISNAQSITTQTLDVGGNTILLNSNTTGSPTLNASITVVRGSSSNAIIRWDESIDEWTIDEGTGTPGHIISSEKSFTNWNDYASALTYRKDKYPVGASVSNATNELAKTANTVAYSAEALAITANTKAHQAYDQANTDVTSVSITAGNYGSASIIPVFRAEANGRISSIANATISISGEQTSITGVGTLANGTWTANSISTTYTDAKITSVGTNTGAISNTQLLDFIEAVDGAGSNLDADLLDGLQGTSYANSTFAQAAFDTANLKFDTAGGTITGNMTVNGNVTTTNLVLSSAPTANQGALKLTGTPSPTNINTGVLQLGPPLGFNDTNILASMTHNINTYVQMILQNANNGTQASADYIVNNDRPGGTATYGDFGINSSNYTGASPFNEIDGVYLYGAGGSLTVGTNGAKDFRIATNDTLRSNVNATTGKFIHLNDMQVNGNLAVGGDSPGKVRTVNFLIDGAGSVITAGPKGNVVVDFAGTINGWTLLNDISGSIKVDVSKATYAGYPAFTASAGQSPESTSAQKSQNTAINWTGFTTVAAGDILQFVVSGTPTGTTKTTVSLKITSTT